MGVHEAAREGWLGAVVGAPRAGAHTWGADVGRLGRAGAEEGGEGGWEEGRERRGGIDWVGI